MEPENDRVALAIDPGRAKCGLAVVRCDAQVLFRAVIPADQALNEIQVLIASYRPQVLLVGDGTGSRGLLEMLEAAALPISLVRVDESYTSEAARTRFVAENPARGWQKLLPRSLRTPWRAYDDYVAVILAERYWQSVSPKK